MRRLVSIHLFVLLAVSANAIGPVFQQGHKWEYSYYALLRSGSLLPAEAHSQWELKALLTITAQDAIVIAQLSNFNTSLYNGLKNEIPDDLHFAPIPQEADPLGTPFIINYNGSLVDSITVDENDPLWSVNIKRAIASIMQLDLDKLDAPASLISENTIYGECHDVEHSVVNNTDYVYVRKVLEHGRCTGFPGREWSSAARFTCPSGDLGVGVKENPFTAATTREYTLAHRDNTLHLEHVLSSRRLYVQPFQAYGEAHQSYQQQVYQLLNKSPVSEPADLPANPITTSLTYVQKPNDLTHDRNREMRQQNIINYIDYLLDQVVDNLEEQNLDQNIVKLHKELMMMYYDLSLLTTESLKKLYSDIAIGTSYQQETKRNMFLELLPQIGSDVSVNFMKDLIVKRDLKDLISIKMLSMFPFYVKQHNTKLLSDMEVLLTLGDNYDSKIRYTAILSFATLVYQTYKAGECSLEDLDNYAIKYFNWFSESNSFEKRMLYLQGLDNLQLGAVPKYLKSIIQSNEQSRHIRTLATWAGLATAPTRPKETYEVHWPILTDRFQPLEMRITSFLMLLTAQPTRSRLLTLFWYMQAETNPHLYNFFYTTMISLQNTQYPCYKHLGKLSTHIIRFLRTPRTKQQWMTGNYILDYANSERAFGALIQLYLIGDSATDSPNIIYLNVNNYATEKNLNQIAVYLKLQGVSDHVRNVLNSEVLDEKNIDKMIKLLEKADAKVITPEEIHIELIVKIQGKTVFCYHIDADKFKKVSEEFLSLKTLLEYHVNYQSIVVPYTREYVEPSDMGTLVIRGIVSNSIASTRGNFLTHTTKQTHTHNFAVDFRYYTYTTSFLELYNPISNTWHGVEKGKKLQARVLFNGTLQLDLEDGKSQVRLREARDGHEYISVLLHSQSLTYLMGNGTRNLLQKHCPKCQDMLVVSAGGHKEEKNLIDFPFENFGNKFQVSIFDCESYPEIKKIFSDVYTSHLSNSQMIPYAKPLLYGVHLADYISYIPTHGSCGVSVHLKPLYREPTQLEVTFTMPQSYNLSFFDPSEKPTENVNILTLTQRKLPDGPLLQYWNATLLSLFTPEKRFMNISLVVEHKNAAEDHSKLCVNAKLNLPQIQSDMFSVKMSAPSTAVFNAVWGEQEQNESSCPGNNNSASIQAIVTASVTDEQIDIANRAEKWPYKNCKEISEGHKFTPISLPCYLASKESATYRKYESDIKFSNMPEWFISTAQKVQSLIGLIQTHSSQNDMIAKSSQTTNLKTLIEFSVNEPKMTLKLNSKDAIVNYDGFEFIDKFLINARFLIQDDLNIHLGLNKVCLITPSSITTVDNRTILVDEIKLRTKNVLATADCTASPKFAVFLDGSANFEDLAFSVYAGSDELNVKTDNKSISVLLNGEQLKDHLSNSYIDAWRLQDDVILLKTKYGALSINIYYTKEYIVISVPGFYTGKTCGICNSIKNNLS